MARTVYTDSSLLLEDKIDLLKNRGLNIENEGCAKHVLQNVSMFRMKGYLYPLREDKVNHIYKDSATFEQAFELYRFDSDLNIPKIKIMFRRFCTAIFVMALTLSPFYAMSANIAPKAKVTASNFLSQQFCPENVNDGVIMYENKGEWACKGNVAFWGVMYLPWVQLDWENPVMVDRILIYDRPSMKEHLAGGTLHFSDGTEISVTCIPNNGTPKEIKFDPKTVSWIKFEATDGDGKDLGLSEIEVFETKTCEMRSSELVNPYIETTRGRWFFCTPGGLPMGMVAAHAFTRNKNQGGGGLNWNFDEVLGITQINDWMMSGPNLMPVSGDIDPEKGIDGWKSKFSHASETIRPGYHKLFLEKYSTWVEYTATQRVVFYRMRYADNNKADLIVDVGSKLGNCTMTDAVLEQVSKNKIQGHFMTIKRLWGGPNQVNLAFVLECDKPIKEVIKWPDGSMHLVFDLGETDMAKVKIAMSYTDVANAQANLDAELPGWDYDATVEASAKEWDNALGRIKVEGKDLSQITKFYTDLWHVLLGRHKINDINGYYPDYTAGPYVGHRTDAKMVVRRLPMGENNRPKHNMYGFDALWLTQWNLNLLWGLAWPEIVDDFTACLVQYAENGGLLPRGACAGGYSFIMTGCPATNMLVSAYMKDIMRKTSAERAFEAMKRNHLPGGMMNYEEPDNLEFYIKNGYCPGNAGITLECAFQDWALSQMAEKMGKKEDAAEFARRSHAWTPLFDEETKMILTKDKDGKWTHKDLLSGSGWIEANSWQGTWSLSHDLKKLASMMGGEDVFCEKLNHAFEMARASDFVNDYNEGYVSYANQPGCSNAHLFSYAGKPWLTQYWVRRVREQAYGGTTQDKGYGGHDEDQGQMGGVSALMSIGIFSVTGTESMVPYYDITSPIFDKVTIYLNKDYYSGEKFVIETSGNSSENCYIQSAKLNGKSWKWSQISHEDFAKGGILELTMSDKPKKSWGALLY